MSRVSTDETRASLHAELDAEQARIMAALEAPSTSLEALASAVELLADAMAKKKGRKGIAAGKTAGGTTGPSFATSEFKRLYDLQAPVKEQYQLFSALHLFLKAYAALKGKPESQADELFQELQQQAFNCSQWDALLSEVEKIAVVLWTSASRRGLGIEFCSILNEVLRLDAADVLPHAAVLCRAMASLVVTRRKDTAVLRWPSENVSHRGTSMPRAAVDFFAQGKLYRAPMFLATSFLESKANEFMMNAPAERTPVHFKFKLDPSKKCDHALYIEGMTLVEGEHEMLYAPYSAFRVDRVMIPEGPITWDNPIVIELLVQPNNKTVAEDIPLASWH